MFWHQEYDFFEITSETPRTFISLSNKIRLPGSGRVLSKENKKLMKGKALRKHSLHEKTAASVLLKLFISGNE